MMEDSMFKELFQLRKYTYLLQQLVRRDFQLKYRGSIFGVLWSVLNPLLNMLVLSVVFSQVFKQVDNYMLYILSGITVFTYVSEATQQGLTAVVANFGLAGKVNVPKMIFPISKVLSSAISFVITTIVFLVLSWFTGIQVTAYYLLIPVLLCLVIMFAMGVSFVLSAAQVFFRDTQHLYGVFCTIWMYATPILYPLETTIPENLQVIFKCNPMYHYVTFFRDVAFYGQMPSLITFVVCVGLSIGAFLLGLFLFQHKQNSFIYYM